MIKINLTLAILLACVFMAFSQEKGLENPVNKTEKSSGIIFKSQIYDFGTLEYGAEAIGVFEFKNISKKPIKLTNVKASCGCTGTEWSRDAIAKKKKSKISVSYDTKRIGKFDKNIYVYVEGTENPIQLQVRGEVLAPKADVKDKSMPNENIQKQNIDGKPVNSQIKEMPKSIQLEEKKNQNIDGNKENLHLKKQVEPVPLKKKIENE